MKKRNRSMLVTEILNDLPDIINLFSQHSIIFTQRYHGMVLADLCRRPSVSISHHDKLLPEIPYFGASKQAFHDSINKKYIKDYSDNFDILKQKVSAIL